MRGFLLSRVLWLGLSALLPDAVAAAPDTTPEMSRMLRAVQQDAARTAAYTGRSAISADVMNALARVPREAFVPGAVQAFAYGNHALGIGHGQTISQPFIVALMTDLLRPRADHTVLEIGTGSGYQAAVLAELVRAVYSIEIIPQLAERAAERLREQGYESVRVRAGDGRRGWPDAGPFDGVLVTAVASTIPPALLEQLRPGGRLVMPVGEVHGGQMLRLVEKDAQGRLTETDVLPVQFVPLTGGP